MEHQHTSFQFFFKLIKTSLLCIIISTNSFAFASSSNCTATRTFIQTECNTTRFPGVCFKALAPFACKIKPGDQVELCRAAFSKRGEIAGGALQTMLYVQQEPCVQANATEAGVLNDCVNVYYTALRFTYPAWQMLNNNVVINESTLPGLKSEISRIISTDASSNTGCLKKVVRLTDDLKKKIYAPVVYSIKLDKIITTLVNRIHV